MGDISLNKYIRYEDKTYDLGLAHHGRLYHAMRTDGRGSIAARGKSRATAIAVYKSYLGDVREVLEDGSPCPDRAVWTSQGKTANRLGISDRSVRTAEAVLVAAGYIYEWRSPRMPKGAETTCWWVVDLEAEAEDLARWTVARRVELLAQTNGAPTEGDIADADRAVEAEVASARAAFGRAYPGHVTTDGHTLAILERRTPRVGATKSEAYAAHASARAAVVKVFDERGVADAPAVVAELLAARKAAGQSTSAKAMRRMLEDGTLEDQLPDVHVRLESAGAGVDDPEPTPTPVAAPPVEPAPAPVVVAPPIAPASRPLSDRARHERRGAARRRFGSVVADLRAAGVGADDAADAVADAVAGFTAAWQAAHGSTPTDIQLDLAMGDLGTWAVTPDAALPALDGVPVPIPASLQRPMPAAA